jgi:hypothetical protein
VKSKALAGKLAGAFSCAGDDAVGLAGLHSLPEAYLEISRRAT